MPYCEKCGSKIRESASFCPSCGAKIPDEINGNNDCVTDESIYQDDESGVVYKYNSASIGGIIVACGTLAVSVSTIITQGMHRSTNFGIQVMAHILLPATIRDQ